MATEIKYINADKETAEWATKSAILIRYDGLKLGLLSTFLNEMEDSKEFVKGIMRPGHRTTLIHIETFNKYLKHRETNRFK